jgi:hypothetical protein
VTESAAETDPAAPPLPPEKLPREAPAPPDPPMAETKMRVTAGGTVKGWTVPPLLAVKYV